jgi:2'-5' RNA ligase
MDSYSETNFGIMEVDSVLLMKSELEPSGARYTKIAEAYLGKTGA